MKIRENVETWEVSNSYQFSSKMPLVGRTKPPFVFILYLKMINSGKNE